MTNVELHSKLCEDLHALYVRKNNDYGDSFHTTFLEEGMVMPRLILSDKLYLFKNLSRKYGNKIFEQQVINESLEDTLMDMANYALMTILEIRRD